MAREANRTPKKERGAIVKRTPTKGSPTKGTGPESASTSERNLQFLWDVVQLSGGITPNWEAIANKHNLSSGAAKKRWARLKKKLEDLDTARQEEDTKDAEKAPEAESVAEANEEDDIEDAVMDSSS